MTSSPESLPGGAVSSAPPPPRDDLLNCLLLVAQAHGVSSSRDTLLAGLPLENNNLSPSLFSRAAQRAGLVSRLTERSLDQLNPALFPVILLLDQDQDQACILVNLDADKAQVI